MQKWVSWLTVFKLVTITILLQVAQYQKNATRVTNFCLVNPQTNLVALSAKHLILLEALGSLYLWLEEFFLVCFINYNPSATPWINNNLHDIVHILFFLRAMCWATFLYHKIISKYSYSTLALKHYWWTFQNNWNSE